MVIETNENTVYFDCDDTLVMWQFPLERTAECVMFNSFGTPEWLLPHEPHIEQLKKFKARGYKVVVWTMCGSEWAAEVVKTLGLEEYVDVATGKPKWIIDDLPANMWTQRSYLDINGNRVLCKDNPEAEREVYADEELNEQD